MSGRLENDSIKLLELKLNLEGNMAGKIQNAYETSKNIYDDVLTQRNIFSKLYIKLFWSGTDDNDIARKVLSYVPDDFSGNLLDVPVGTAVFTENKWSSLKNAHFSYTGEEKDEVLHGIDLTMPAGSFTALVGPSGGGKSTVARLISRFWDVTSGSITIGDVNIKEIPLSQLSEMISFVTQDNFLFRCSIMENLRSAI